MQNEGRIWLAARGRKTPISPDCRPGLGTLPTQEFYAQASNILILLEMSFIADNYSSHFAYLFYICSSYESCSSFKRNFFWGVLCDLFFIPEEIGGSFFLTIMVPYICFCIWTYHLCLIACLCVCLFLSQPSYDTVDSFHVSL